MSRLSSARTASSGGSSGFGSVALTGRTLSSYSSGSAPSVAVRSTLPLTLTLTLNPNPTLTHRNSPRVDAGWPACTAHHAPLPLYHMPRLPLPLVSDPVKGTVWKLYLGRSGRLQQGQHRS